jgi:hypothetical protein
MLPMVDEQIRFEIQLEWLLLPATTMLQLAEHDRDGCPRSTCSIQECSEAEARVTLFRRRIKILPRAKPGLGTRFVTSHEPTLRTKPAAISNPRGRSDTLGEACLEGGGEICGIGTAA